MKTKKKEKEGRGKELNTKQRNVERASDYMNYKIGQEDDIFVRLHMILGTSKKELRSMLDKF